MTSKTCVWPVLFVLACPGAASMALAHPNIDELSETTSAEQQRTVDCTLENGAATTCYKLTANDQPEGLDIRPFCPAIFTDAGVIWEWTAENAKLYRVDSPHHRTATSNAGRMRLPGLPAGL
ncbi:hypothetical protein [Paracoccus sp. Ld10]|uniref:hypothetical protein n=1 Tax=Paracoccus sp. Ld10 TaxID=649158 RepID=UPI00386C5722